MKTEDSLLFEKRARTLIEDTPIDNVSITDHHPENLTASSIYNSYIGSYVIFALYETGILSLFDQEEIVDINSVDTDSKTNKAFLFNIASDLGFLTIEKQKAQLTDLGKDILENVGFFLWAIGGYSKLLQAAPDILSSKPHQLKNLVYGDYVALGSYECGQRLMNNILKETMSDLSYNVIADLGCGNAGRLINFVNAKTGAKGIGLDINADAIALAKTKVENAGLTESISLHCENIFNSLTNESKVFEEVDVVTNFMVFHDILNMEEIHDDIFYYFEKTFPNAEYYLIADTVKGDEYESSSLPIFSLGFEFIHKLMNVRLFPLEYYLDFFEKSGLSLEAIKPFGVPNTYIFLLKKIH